MASVAIYLNFAGNAEEAFNHYKKAFRSEFSSPIMRMGDTPRRKATCSSGSREKQSGACGIAHTGRHADNGDRYAGKHGT